MNKLKDDVLYEIINNKLNISIKLLGYPDNKELIIENSIETENEGEWISISFNINKPGDNKNDSLIKLYNILNSFDGVFSLAITTIESRIELIKYQIYLDFEKYGVIFIEKGRDIEQEGTNTNNNKLEEIYNKKTEKEIPEQPTASVKQSNNKRTKEKIPEQPTASVKQSNKIDNKNTSKLLAEKKETNQNYNKSEYFKEINKENKQNTTLDDSSNKTEQEVNQENNETTLLAENKGNKNKNIFIIIGVLLFISIVLAIIYFLFYSRN